MWCSVADLDEHLCLNIFDASSSDPRYSVHIIDSPTVRANKFAIFIVPQGRYIVFVHFLIFWIGIEQSLK